MGPGAFDITAAEEQFQTRKEDQQTSNKKKYQKKTKGCIGTTKMDQCHTLHS